MAKLTPADVIRPTPPGISWTAPAKGRPWSQPPKIVKLSAIAQGYIDNLSSASSINSVIDAIETKVPLASLAEALMLSSVNKGIHTIDTGILVMPVIIEMLATAAEIHGIEYTIFPDESEVAAVPERVIREALKEVSEKKDVVEETPEPSVKLSGLMSRKTSEEM